jgi:hypothetical protein
LKLKTPAWPLPGPADSRPVLAAFDPTGGRLNLGIATEAESPRHPEAQLSFDWKIQLF